jgi:cellulose synthase A
LVALLRERWQLASLNAIVCLSAGSPRVQGDEDDSDVEDLDDEYDVDYDDHENQHNAEVMLHGHMSYGRGNDLGMPRSVQTIEPQNPLFTSGSQV